MRFINFNNENIESNEKRVRYTNCYYCEEKVRLDQSATEIKNKESCDKIYLCEVHKRIKVNKIKLRKR